jgi:hypothetical protein
MAADDLKFPVSINFTVSNPSVFVSYGERNLSKIRYDLRSDRFRDSVKIAGGGDIMRMPGSLHITGIPEGDDAWERVGSIYFIPASSGSRDGVISPSDDHFSVECGIPLAELKEIIAAERASKGASSVRITVSEGMEYGWAPDGSQIEWDNGDRNRAPISELSLDFFEARKEEHEKADDMAPDQSLQSMTEVRSSIDSLARLVAVKSQWVIGPLLFIAVWLAIQLR